MENEIGIGHRVPDVGKAIGNCLESCAVLIDGEGALPKASKFGLQLNCSGGSVVSEKIFYRFPDLERSGARLDDQLKDILTYAAIDPRGDSEVKQGLKLIDNRVRVSYVRGKIVFSEGNFKQMTPVSIVRRGLREGDGDKVLD